MEFIDELPPRENVREHSYRKLLKIIPAGKWMMLPHEYKNRASANSTRRDLQLRYPNYEFECRDNRIYARPRNQE